LIKNDYSNFKRYINSRKSEIKNIDIFDGSSGPLRSQLSSYFDWGPHVYATLQSLGFNQFNATLKVYKINAYEGFVLTGCFENIIIKAKFGNNFTEKTRKIIIRFKNNENIIFDFNEVKLNKKREMDRLINFSKYYFFNSKINKQKVYSCFRDNDHFLLDNAKLTMKFARNNF
jgi:hypothetical protein